MTENKEPRVALLRLVKSKRALNHTQLFKLIDEMYKHHHVVFAASSFGNDPHPDIEDVYEYVEDWPEEWGHRLLKTGVYYITIHFAEEPDLDKVFDATNMFFYEVFCQQEEMYNYVFAIKRVKSKTEVHAILHRYNCSRHPFRFKNDSYYSFESLRKVLAEKSTDAGIPMIATPNRKSIK